MNATSILIVDDVEGIRAFVSLVLKRMNFQDVETAGSTAEALDKAKNAHFDLIFLDINMPPTSGLDLLKDLQVQSPLSKVVMCSASSSDDNIETALANGALGFLVKPVTPVGLVSILQRLGFKDS